MLKQLRKELKLKRGDSMKHNKKEQSKNNRSFVIGKSRMTITKKGIKLQTPKLIIHHQKLNFDYKCQE